MEVAGKYQDCIRTVSGQYWEEPEKYQGYICRIIDRYLAVLIEALVAEDMSLWRDV